jgi:phosphoserine phosphatase RsbU/P
MSNPTSAGYKDSDSQKQLELNSLIEFSQLISSQLDLKFIFNNILLSIMGKMLITKGMVFLKDQDEVNSYSIITSKGFSASNIPEKIEIEFPKLPIFKFEEITGCPEWLCESGLNNFFKVYFQKKLLGVLSLSDKLNKSGFSKSEIIFIETLLNISSPAIENTIKFTNEKNLNLKLTHKNYYLTSLFELSKDFNISFLDKEKILKILNFSLMGNFGVRDYLIITKDKNENFYVLKDNKKIDLSDKDLNELNKFESTTFIKENSEDPLMKYLYQNGLELLIPSINHGKVENVICLGRKLKNEPYNENDIEYLESIANLSLLSLKNSLLFEEYLEKQKMENELKIAREIQIALLPESIPVIVNYDIYAENIPALQVGGDYYDIIKINESKSAIIIADVSGKGTPASLLMANIQSAVHSFLKIYEEDFEGFNIAKVTEKINSLIYENTSAEKFITFFWGILNPEENSFEYINAGHNPPYLFRDNEVILLSEGGFMIGILDSGFSYDIGKIQLEKNDVIIFYTDGVTEALNINKEEFGEERLKSIMKENLNENSVNIHSLLKDNIEKFTDGAPQYDDITMIVLKRIK